MYTGIMDTSVLHKALLVIFVSAIITSCDMTVPKQQRQENPYLHIQDLYVEAFQSGASRAMQETESPVPVDTFTKRYAKGVSAWIKENRNRSLDGAPLDEFGDVNRRLRSKSLNGNLSKQANISSLDELLEEAGVSGGAKQYIEQIPQKVAHAESYEEVDHALDKFDKQINSALIGDERDLALQSTALVRAQFLALEATSADHWAEFLEEHGNKSGRSKADPPHENPPQWSTFFDASTVATGVLWGAVSGGAGGDLQVLE